MAHMRLDELRVGDQVRTPDGIATVTRVDPQGERRVWEVHADGQVIDASGDHVFAVWYPELHEIISGVRRLVTRWLTGVDPYYLAQAKRGMGEPAGTDIPVGTVFGLLPPGDRLDEDEQRAVLAVLNRCISPIGIVDGQRSVEMGQMLQLLFRLSDPEDRLDDVVAYHTAEEIEGLLGAGVPCWIPRVGE